MRIYLPEKVIFTEAANPKGISLLRVDKFLFLTKLKSMTVLLCERKFSTFTFVTRFVLLKSCST